MSTIVQRSFAGGEITPSLYARVDTARYAVALRTLKNSYVMRHGGATNRAGTAFVGEVKDSTKAVKLVPFIYSSDQTYVIEMGDQYIRFHKDGDQVKEAAKTITGITNANPGVVSSTAHGYSNGDEVYISGIVGAIGTYINNRNFKVANVTANTFELQYMDGTNVNTTSFGSYTSGGSSYRVYTISSPYLEAELPTVQYVQSADVVTFVHPNHAPRELARIAETNWTLTSISFAPTIDAPINGVSTSGGAGAETYRWKITAIKAETFEESLTGTDTPKTITNITQSPSCVVTINAHGYANGDKIYITGVVGMTEVNNRFYTVSNRAANTFVIKDENGTTVNSSGYTAYTSGGTSTRQHLGLFSVIVPTTAAPHTLTWDPVTDAIEYNIYKEINGIYGFIGVAGSNSFEDTGIDPDTSITPPIEVDLFNATDDYPSTVTYYQQRLGFAASNNDIEKIWFSKTALFKNFTSSSPIQDDDAVTFTMSGRQVNKVKHMIDIGKLIVFTQGGEWSIEGGADGIIRPGEINPKQYSYNGSSDLQPIVIGSNALYVQARGSVVRDFSFDFAVDGYRGNDLTIFSAHLFDDYQIVDWTYQQVPHSILWAVRDDGVLIGLTYVREQEMIAWHRHDTDGTVENVCSVPEGSEDAVYVVVKRTIDGVEKRYVERFASRNIDLIVDAKFLDAHLSYDGRNTNLSHTMTLSGSGWTYLDTLTLTSSTSYFSASEVGNEIHLVGASGDIIRFEITGFTSGTVVTGKPNKTVPVNMRTTAINSWSRAVDEVSGLWHLEGKDVSIFADGFVVANPNNNAYDVVTVNNGTIILDKSYAVIHVGLPYASDIETLNIDTAQGETISDKKQIVNKVTIFVEDSRGAWIGAKPPPDEDSDFLGGLTETKVRNDESYDDPVSLRTGTIDVNIQSEWNSNGRVFIRQTDPIPLSVLAIAPAGLFPFRG